MKPNPLTPELPANPQIALDEVAEAKAAGFRAILCNRPDGEAAGQPPLIVIQAGAARLGLESRYAPVVSGRMTDADVAAFKAAFAELPKPVLGSCASGKRVAVAAHATGLTESSRKPEPAVPKERRRPQIRNYEIVIVGGGAAGIAVAASLLKRPPDLKMAIVETAENHLYSRAGRLWAGVFTPEQTRHSTASVMPSRATWVKDAVTTFQPEENRVTLGSGDKLCYARLIVAPGLKLDGSVVEGLVDKLGKPGVTANHRYEFASVTWKLVRSQRSGRALFTPPAMPITRAGATAAAVRKQAPIVAENLLSDLGRIKSPSPAVYDGYGTCPPTVERGQIVLAEFGYGGKRPPSSPHGLIDDLKPSSVAWLLKTCVLPPISWDAILKGRELLATPQHTPAAARLPT